MIPYDHKKIEKKWQAKWKKNGTYKTKEQYGKKKCYVLDMFPYPSGEGLHVGHPKGYIATDVYSRFKRSNGYAVLHPMGFDAFGLPAENYAIAHKVNPAVAVSRNVKRFKKQLEVIGLDYDWSREVNTTDHGYYKWTQWIFLQMYKAGLAYESHEPINWCPSCKTGLANEDVEDGRCERCGTLVEKKPLRQWVLRITNYAEKLLDGLPQLDWPESIKELQRNWIGKSEGSEIEFKLKTQSAKLQASVKVFTTRADTLFGATYVVLAPEHPLLANNELGITNYDEVLRYIEVSKVKTEIERTAEGKEKTGVELKGIKAINPATSEEIPVFIADYVLAGYGTGAIMAVPAHDERDFEFAKKYNLPIKQVVAPIFKSVSGSDAVKPDLPFKPREAVMCIVKHWEKEEYLCLQWKEFPEVRSFISGGIEEGEDAVSTGLREIREESGYMNARFIRRVGMESYSEFYHQVKKVNVRAHFRYLYFELENGEQVPVDPEETKHHEVFWKKKDEVIGFLSLIEKETIWNDFLKGEHAETKSGYLLNSGKFNELISTEAVKNITDFVGGKMVTKYKLRDWVFSRQRYWGEPIPLIHCEKCGVVPVPEKELPVKLPKVAHYEPTGTGESPLAGIPKWVNVKCPECKGPGKRETNTMPQWAGSSWYWLRYMDPKNTKRFVDAKKEKYWSPVDFYVGGAEHATRHLIYARFWHRFLFDKKLVAYPEPFTKLQHVGLILAEDGRKMSKRWGNVINPDDIIERFGADSLRLYEMFMGPFDQATAWNTDNLVGARRFIERVWRLHERVAPLKTDTGDEKELHLELQRTIQKVTNDITAFKFNTAISQLMIFTNMLEKKEKFSREIFKTFLLLLAPFAPHVSEELWSASGGKGSVVTATWPLCDESVLQKAVVIVGVQVNGKSRGIIEVLPGTKQEEAFKLALKKPEIEKWIGSAIPKKIIYIEGKILSIVI